MKLAVAGVGSCEGVKSGRVKIGGRAKNRLSRWAGDVPSLAPLPASSILWVSPQFTGLTFYLHPIYSRLRKGTASEISVFRLRTQNNF